MENLDGKIKVVDSIMGEPFWVENLSRFIYQKFLSGVL